MLSCNTTLKELYIVSCYAEDKVAAIFPKTVAPAFEAFDETASIDWTSKNTTLELLDVTDSLQNLGGQNRVRKNVELFHAVRCATHHSYCFSL
jgi:hypothetical protein